jgi:hypothetical protein
VILLDENDGSVEDRRQMRPDELLGKAGDPPEGVGDRLARCERNTALPGDRAFVHASESLNKVRPMEGSPLMICQTIGARPP